MNAQTARKMNAEALGMFDIAALDGATSVATTRYQHGVVLAMTAPAAKLTIKTPSAAPKLGMNYTPKAPTF